MMIAYVVLPFTTNYKSPQSAKMRVFSNRTQAEEYANKFKCVEMVTTRVHH